MNEFKVVNMLGHYVKTMKIDGETVYNPYDVGKVLGMTTKEIDELLEDMDDKHKVAIPNK